MTAGAHDWEGRSAAAWQAAWRLPTLEIHPRITSTSDRARELAARGAPAGTVVLAELQTAGRGRHGRPWHAAESASLLLSFLFRPADAAGDAAPGTAPLRIGTAIADVIADVSGVECSVKWPNDLVVPGRGKLAGILCEAVTGGPSGSHLVAGIGINVRQTDADWPAELRGRATSLDACADRPTDRPALAAAIIDAVRPLFTAPLLPLSTAELRAFERRDALRGQLVRAATGLVGTARGVDPDGALVVETEAGLQRVTSASLRLAGSAGAAYP